MAIRSDAISGNITSWIVSVCVMEGNIRHDIPASGVRLLVRREKLADTDCEPPGKEGSSELDNFGNS